MSGLRRLECRSTSSTAQRPSRLSCLYRESICHTNHITNCANESSLVQPLGTGGPAGTKHNEAMNADSAERRLTCVDQTGRQLSALERILHQPLALAGPQHVRRQPVARGAHTAEQSHVTGRLLAHP